MKKPKQKMTQKEMLNIIDGLMMGVSQIKMIAYNTDKLITEYITFKKEQGDFKMYLQSKFEPNDKDNEEIKEK